MECPESCSDQVYQLMKDCWNYEPENRPHFLGIREILRKFTESRFPMLLERQDSAIRIQKSTELNIKSQKTSVTHI